ncbi:unnamed protein product [Aphanomyces euteiches]
MSNKTKTTPTLEFKIHRGQSATTSQDSDTTSNSENNSLSDEFDFDGAFTSTTLVDFTVLEEQDTPELRAIHREFDAMIAQVRSSRTTTSKDIDKANNQDDSHVKKKLLGVSNHEHVES